MVAPENERFADVFTSYKMGTLTRNGLIVPRPFNIHKVYLEAVIRNCSSK